MMAIPRSFEKAMKGACKPKPNPPKAKYLDPILAATWSEDGAVHDVCRALAPRFKEPNVLIVFKALIVLHSMIRNGSTDNVLSYLSQSDVLRLKNVSTGNWEGYAAPQNIQHYSTYLDTRIRAFRELKHDAVRVQSENNRDMRLSQALEEDRDRREGGSRRSRPKEPPASSRPKDPPAFSGVQRSKTLAGRKLRIMTVEKGLLRETRVVQKMIDALVECRFYLDDLDNELNITALRMLTKDLLILFQACNEGVINVLEHYFEMFRSDAEEALNLYRHFCKETERVVEYLGVAKKLQNILNVPIPNLRHAPVSLAGALEEYLKDPNFEQNRIEYRTNKEAAERAERLGISAPPPQAQTVEKAPESGATADKPADQSKPPTNQALIDFFSAIEEEQQTMFNPQTGSPSTAYFQQHAVHNPFAQQMHQMQMPMMTGAPFDASQPFAQPQMQVAPQVQSQPTGFLVPQYTSTNPFGMLQQQQHQQIQQQPAPFLQPQHTAFLQPQATGANPFRQSTMLPQMTGMSPFGMPTGAPQHQPASTNPFPVQNNGQPQGFPGGSNAPNFNAFSAMAGSSQIAQPFAQSALNNTANIGPARPGSAPLTALSSPPASSSGPPRAEPVKTHQTGSRNPFGTPVTAPPPVPKPPTMFELAMGGGQNQTFQQNGFQQPSSPVNSGLGMNGFGPHVAPQQTGSVMASVASEFSFNKSGQGSPAGAGPQAPSATGTSSMFSDTLFSSLASQPTGATTTSLGSFNPSNPSISVSPAAPLQPQKTGFSGLKPFKPSSSFGAALFESLPPIPSAPTTPSESPQPSFPSSTQNGSANGQNSMSGGPFGMGSTGTGSGLGTQPTGFGGFASQPTASNPQSSGSQPTGAFASQPTGALSGFGGNTVGSGLRPQMTGAAGAANPFRATMFSTTAPSMAGGGFGGGSGGLPNSSSMPGLGNSPFSTNNPNQGAPSFGSGPFSLGGGIGQNSSQPQQQSGSASLI